MPLVEGFGSPWFGQFPPEVECRWDREWRCLIDFDVLHTEVAFGSCPSAEITHFENLSNNLIPFVDLSTTTTLAAAKAKLAALPRFQGLKL